MEPLNLGEDQLPVYGGTGAVVSSCSLRGMRRLVSPRPGAPLRREGGGREQLIAAAVVVEEQLRDERHGDVVVGPVDDLDLVPGVTMPGSMIAG